MSRNKRTNDILTPRKQAKVGTRVLRGTEPVALVGPEKNKDTFSLVEFAEALYGPGTQCIVIPANKSGQSIVTHRNKPRTPLKTVAENGSR